MTKIINNLTSDVVRVRIAPSPTGVPHIGNTRTALFNYLFARHNKGKFIVRIEDTDRARLVPESEEAIYEILKWLGLTWDEKYKQSERVEIYKKHAEQLLKKDLAYKDEGAMRFKMPKTGETFWNDLIGHKHISFKNETQEDFIIIKSDGFPTYNFANVIDDHLMEITHVIRGEEFISSTPKHIQLYKAFNWPHPEFAHLPIILGPDRTKLSKRHGAESVLYYREQGYLKEAILNYMVLLGWNPGEDREIMDIKVMRKLFDLKDVNTNSPIFNIDKLNWFNGYYIRSLSEDKLFLRIKNIGLEIKDERLARQLVSPAQSRMETLNDFTGLIKPFVETVILNSTIEHKEIIKELLTRFKRITEWKRSEIYIEIRHLCISRRVNMKIVYKALTGKEEGLPLADTFEILGKEKVLARLSKLERLKKETI